MTIREAIDKLNEIKAYVPNSDDKEKIIGNIEYVLNYLDGVNKDVLLGGPSFELSKDVSKLISDANSHLAHLDMDWSTKLVSAVLALSKAKESACQEVKERAKQSSVAADKWHKILCVAGIAAFVIVGVGAIILAIVGEKAGIKKDTVDIIVSCCGLFDFMMGGFGFFVERLSDIKARQIKAEIAESAQNGVADIEKQTTLEGVDKAKEATKATIVEISGHHNVYSRFCGKVIDKSKVYNNYYTNNTNKTNK